MYVPMIMLVTEAWMTRIERNKIKVSEMRSKFCNNDERKRNNGIMGKKKDEDS